MKNEKITEQLTKGRILKDKPERIFLSEIEKEQEHERSELEDRCMKTEYQKKLLEAKNFISTPLKFTRRTFGEYANQEIQYQYEVKRFDSTILCLKDAIKDLNTKIDDAKNAQEEMKPIYGKSDIKNYQEYSKKISDFKSRLDNKTFLLSEPYFARMDVEIDGKDFKSIYIGKVYDPDNNIFSWESPVPFEYNNKSSPSFVNGGRTYKVILRRAFSSKKEKLEKYKDEYLNISKYLSKEEIAQYKHLPVSDGFLLEVLKSRKDVDKAKDIIATIQQEQYQIISKPSDSNFVMQACAGGGKTVILLHRLTYMLTNEKELDRNKVLIISQNPLFKQYLGELAYILKLKVSMTSTLDEYYLGFINHGLKQKNYNLKDFNRQKGDVDDQIYSQATAESIKSCCDNLLADFNNEIDSLYDESILNAIEIANEARVALGEMGNGIRVQFVGEQKYNFERNMYYFTQNYSAFIKKIATATNIIRHLFDAKHSRLYLESNSLVNELANILASIRKEDDNFQRYYINLYRYISDLKDGKKVHPNLNQEIESAQKAIKHLEEIHKLIEQVFSIKEKLELKKNVLKKYNFDTFDKYSTHILTSATDLTKEDLAKKNLYLYALVKSCYTSDWGERLQKVLIDEGQDLAPVEYKLLQHINPSAVFNIYGDISQSINPNRCTTDWTQTGFSDVMTLNQNYRNTNQVTVFVNKTLNMSMMEIGVDGKDVVVKKTISELENEQRKVIAVIVKDTPTKDLIKGYFENAQCIKEGTFIDKKMTNILTVEESKGLEFTKVIVFEKNMTPNEKYIAFTRSSNELTVIETLEA